MKKILSGKGFTLIELLIVISIITTLAVAVFVALNPGERLKNTKDAKRTSDVDSILTAIHAYIVDNGGSYPAGLTAGTAISQLGTSASGCSGTVGVCTINVAQDACVNLATPLAPYLQSIPLDPKDGTASKTKYAVKADTNGIVTVTACGSEGSTTIQSSR